MMTELPLFKQYMEHLKRLKLGVRNIPVTVGSPKSSKLHTVRELHADIFEVTVNVAGGTKKWQILFDTDNPSFCPDIIFDSEDDDFFPDITSLKSFYKWDYLSVTALSQLIEELYKEYIAHQRTRIRRYSQLSEQMEELMLTTKYGNCCEIDIKRNGPGTYNDVIKLVIPITVDFSRLPPYMKMKNPGESGCRLCISFEPPNLTKVIPTLELTPAVQNALCRISTLRIPSFDKTLLTYVNRIHNLVETTINETCDAFERRKSLMFSILSEFNGAAIEYDGVMFYEATFLLEINTFHFILFVVLTEKYPHERPILYLQSVYCLDSSSDIYRMQLVDFPYDAQWNDESVISHMKRNIFDKIDEFQQTSLPNQL